MYDMAFTERTLRQQVRRVDFLNFRHLRAEGELEQEINKALTFVQSPDADLSLIKTQRIRTANVRRVEDYHLLLALRKLNANIKHCAQLRVHSRDAVAAALRGMLSESVPFRIYKMDVRRFFESIDRQHVARGLKRIGLERSLTSRLVDAIIDVHSRDGGHGLPRGLAISGTLSDLVMREFDAQVEDRSEVFFYRRYVDDFIVVTSGEEHYGSFVSELARQLPVGLELKVNKLKIGHAAALSGKVKGNAAPRTDAVEFLGYSFRFDAENLPTLQCGHRRVQIDIAASKAKKIKTRIVRSLIDYVANKDFQLLDDRLRHLTSNLSLVDRSSGLSRLVGIHFNYMLVDADSSDTLVQLDRFLTNALSSKKGRVYSQLTGLLSEAQRAQLGRHSFVEGARKKRFFQMGLRQLSRTQRCWKYA